ncbi:ACN9-domain-containing protein [Piedraia hortae CBS 480.64]|uniref:Succinate dehydrogenase assembly factor 3 n=1 Tax=Piedraia hortae CBS 480.64 TaxID=1314780 RepID=A0A6A7C471_9PEZI|nr:ACN9-domain-containing protein [Piedraia hortae CBS 480.64]
MTFPFRQTSRLLASASPLNPHSIPLLPPIPLYRRILRAHRKHLPPEMRILGDRYAAAEFRAHRNVENPAHIIGFLTEWQSYAQQVEGKLWREGNLEGRVDRMSGMYFLLCAE